jgi:hypothetical protein
MSVSAEVSGNSLQVKLSRSDALLLALSVAVLIALWLGAGWKIALAVAGASAFGALVIDEVQRFDIQILGR